MADEIKRDTVDYRDPTPFDGSKLQPISEISKAIRHKTYGVDTREALAQQGEALVKIMQETGGNQSAEVAAARGKFELLGIREDAQDNAIAVTNSNLANKADKTYINDYLSQVSYVPETVASLDELKTKYPNGKSGLFITADNGHKYIWTDGAWKDAGVYQSVGIADGSVVVEKLAQNAQTPIFIPSKDGVPNYSTDTGILDFNCKSGSAYFMLNNEAIEVPIGTTVISTIKPSGPTSAKLVYDYLGKSFSFIFWSQKLKETETLIGGLRLANDNWYWSGMFNITINGFNYEVQRGQINLVPSKDGAPYYDVDDNSLNLNAYTDRPYIVYNGSAYQVPIGTVIKGVAGASSTRFIVNLETMQFDRVGWSANVPVGWCEIATIRKTINNEVLISSTCDIAVKGASFKSKATVNARDAKVIGINHRGFNVVAPEESKSAYLLSKQNGYYHWEGDINWTKDNVPMMIHDLAINRTARNLDGTELSSAVNLTDLNHADLANYDFGIVKGERYKGEPLLSFEELLKLARLNDANLHIEFKYEFTEDQVNLLHGLVVKYNMLDRVAWQSFNGEWLKQMMTLEPNGQFEILGGIINDAYFAKLASYKTESNKIIASQSKAASIADIQKIADKGYPIYIWTVDDGATLRRFRDIGMVSGYITNGAVNVADELTRYI